MFENVLHARWTKIIFSEIFSRFICDSSWSISHECLSVCLSVSVSVCLCAFVCVCVQVITQVVTVNTSHMVYTHTHTHTTPVAPSLPQLHRSPTSIPSPNPSSPDRPCPHQTLPFPPTPARPNIRRRRRRAISAARTRDDAINHVTDRILAQLSRRVSQ